MQIAKEYVLRQVANECVLVPLNDMDQEMNGLITLSDTGRFILERLKQADSLDQLVEMIMNAYEIDAETAKDDAFGFISVMIQLGFLKCEREDMTW